MTRYQIAGVAAFSGTSAALADLAAVRELSTPVEDTTARRWFQWGNRMLFDLGDDDDSWTDELAIERRRREIPG
jgi:hypothetical protein